MLRRITENELLEILRKHEAWLKNESGGARADLTNVNFKGMDLSGVNMRLAILNGANFKGASLIKACFARADLTLANFTGALLHKADFSFANLIDTNFTGAILINANLSFAILYDTKLKDADLSYACFDGAIVKNISSESKNTINYFFPIACPSVGSFIGWKQAAHNTIVKLCIPEDAKRSSAFGRKCRCNKAICLAIENLDGSPTLTTSVASEWDKEFIYEVGKEVRVDDFDENRFNECAPGIHFFITRDEAVNYKR